jgi:hypothetical protein
MKWDSATKQSSKSDIAALFREMAIENKTNRMKCRLQQESTEDINFTFLTKYKQIIRCVQPSFQFRFLAHVFCIIHKPT